MEAVDIVSVIIPIIIFLLAIFVCWVLPINLGIRWTRKKGISPHWMWFGIHPFSGWLAFLIIRFGVEPRIYCRSCQLKIVPTQGLCPNCGEQTQSDLISNPVGNVQQPTVSKDQKVQRLKDAMVKSAKERLKALAIFHFVMAGL